tara:strand:- start:2644 stop:3192 length:549 start_codon:yes stop_codon:yes gene_type:complete
MISYLTSFPKFAAGLALVVSVSGCSILNVGDPDYGCSGMPDGVKCMSTRDVYNLTNDGYVPSSVNTEAQQAAQTVAQTGASSGVGEGTTDPNDVVSNYVAPRLPDQPVPIRTPAQVMRVWIAPWEDDRGDLIVTGHLYTEVEPRRWVIGEQAANTQPSLRPLQSIQQNSDEKTATQTVTERL